MKRNLSASARPTSSTVRRRWPRRPLSLERLEDRLAPSANILVSVDGSYPQQQFREYTPSGALVRTVVVPPGGAAEDARDLVADASGNVYLYNGTFDPYLSTYSTGGTWSHRTYSGWSTVNNTSYGGIGLSGSYVFVTDMTTYGEAADQAKGIVRFNLADGTASRFAITFEPIDLTVGRDGLVYALDSFRTVNVYDPQSMALLRTVTLPTYINGNAQYYGSLAVNAAGELFVGASYSGLEYRFSPAGALLNSVTLPGPGGSGYFGSPSDIDLSGDGRLVLGTTSGHVVQMTDAFTDISYFVASTTGTVFVAFGADTGAPPAASLSINDVSVVEGNSGTTPATFTVSLSRPSTQTVTVSYATASSTAASGLDFQSASGTL